MKAAVVHALGRPPIYAEVEEPRPVDGQVVAQVRAAAVKNIERSLVAGTHYGSSRMRLPGLVGLDAVVSLPDGRRAYAGAAPPGGSMAERVAVDPARVVALPDGVDESAAAALPNAAVSAWFALEYAGGLRPGGAVLVLGGTGVTGSLAVQLAKRVFGAGRVVVAGRDPARLERLTGWGADAVIRIGGADGIEDAVRREHHRRPFDVVVDYLWGAPAEQALRALAGTDLAAEPHRTRFVQVGEMAGPTITLAAGVLRSAGIELVGQGGGSVPTSAFARAGSEIVPRLFAMLAAGELVIDTVARPLAEVSDAWTAPTPSGVRVVLTP